MQTTFHNTIRLQGEDLKQAVINASRQEEAIFVIYLNTRTKWTAWDIYGMMQRAGKRWPITSCRRALTNLMQKGELVKLADQKKGEYDKPEYYYQLNFIKYPTPGLSQPKLFQ